MNDINSLEFSAIKLVIWDLDGTFWRGVLSEGPVEVPFEHIRLIKEMTDAGVINSICSKNDPETVNKKLKDLELEQFFVFRSVNWSPKGERVAQIISEMNLRAENVLFLDDNAINLQEAKSFSPDLMIGGVEKIPELCQYFSEIEKTDVEHRRLEQYRLLERKRQFKAETGSNKEFLWNCHINVRIRHDCENHIDRIAELIARTNQLNFTKKRISKDAVISLIDDTSVETAYVTVTDDFGDYGIVGFYAKKNDILLHFVFSCRTLNMGVEQYVYHTLGQPKIEIIPEVSSRLDLPCPQWINQNESKRQTTITEKKQKLDGKILIKGPCDMEQMFSFIEPSPNIITEFTYINDAGTSIEHYNHTTQIINAKQLSETDKQRMCALPFCDKKMYDTVIFDEDVSIVMFSLFNDPHLGVYREKKTGILMAFGEYLNDLTDESKWDAYFSGKLFNAEHRFTREELSCFKEQFEYVGRLLPVEVLKNLQWIFSELNENAVLILCLGSEMNIEDEAYVNNESYLGRHLYHKELNQLVRDWANGNERVFCIDVNEYVSSRDDFLDTINHMKKYVYYEMSKKFIQIVNSVSNNQLSQRKEQKTKEAKIGLTEHIKRRIRFILFNEK